MGYAAGDLILERMPHLVSYARALTRNRASADDLVQDTVVRILTSIEQFDGSSFASWSGTILRNRFFDNCRRSRRHGGSVEDAAVPEMAEEPAQDFVVELDETLRVLDDLSPKHREILTMICIKEFSYERTARMLRIPIGTVRSRLSRARLELLAIVESGRGARNGVVRRTRNDQHP
jgi:RNA polymerase sigma-70 factor (ECF subfamily)